MCNYVESTSCSPDPLQLRKRSITPYLPKDIWQIHVMLLSKLDTKVLDGGSVNGLSLCELKVLVKIKGCQKVKSLVVH
jgi:hypothetical protein